MRVAALSLILLVWLPSLFFPVADQSLQTNPHSGSTADVELAEAKFLFSEFRTESESGDDEADLPSRLTDGSRESISDETFTTHLSCSLAGLSSNWQFLYLTAWPPRAPSAASCS